jgi:hypothetical protein
MDFKRPTENPILMIGGQKKGGDKISPLYQHRTSAQQFSVGPKWTAISLRPAYTEITVSLELRKALQRERGAEGELVVAKASWVFAGKYHLILLN